MNEDFRLIIDIRTEELVVAIVSVEDDKVVLSTVKHYPSQALSRGVVENFSQLQDEVSQIKEDLEVNPKKTSEVIVGVSSQTLKSRHIEIQEELESETITEKLLAELQDVEQQEGFVTMCYMAPVYQLDGKQIQNPVGKTGQNLSVHIESKGIVSSYYQSLEETFSILSRNVSIYAATPEALLALASKDQLESGVGILDIGLGTTDFCIYQNSEPRIMLTIPIGGREITTDIAYFLNVPFEKAEQVKKWGYALSERGEPYKILTLDKNKEISIQALSKIIQARLEEVLEMIAYTVKKEGISLQDIPLFVIGNVSDTLYLKNLITFKLECRLLSASLQYPWLTSNIEELAEPSHKTLLGLCRRAITSKPTKQKKWTLTSLLFR